MKVLLDTHVWVWSQEALERLWGSHGHVKVVKGAANYANSAN